MAMSSVVSLPSIHEGFPDIDFRDPPSSRSYKALAEVKVTGKSLHSPASARPLHPSIISRSQSSHDGLPRKGDWQLARKDGAGSHLQNEPTFCLPYSRQQSRLQNGHLMLSASASASASATFPSSISHTDLSVSGSTSNDQKSLLMGTHSFDVLRSDPSTFSLEHIASSKTVQSRGPNAIKTATPTGIASGSAPAFRVVLPTATSSSDTRSDAVAGRSFLGVAGLIDARPIPSIVDVDSLHATKMAIDEEIRSRFLEINDRGATFRLEGRGKKHQCPQCPKRFNRPSSLRIHVNTHTGARPFQCPYPNCGREFNVNSNMRRHYRNHSIPATVEVHPPRHNSGRRPRGYPRPHPGHSSTTIFHISNGQSPRATLSAASFTDDDLDIDHSEDGEDSASDDEEADEGGEEEIRTTRYKSSSWSLTPITALGHTRAHSYQCTLSATHTPSFITRYSEISPSVSQHFGSLSYSSTSPTYKDTTVSTTLRPAFR